MSTQVICQLHSTRGCDALVWSRPWHGRGPQDSEKRRFYTKQRIGMFCIWHRVVAVYDGADDGTYCCVDAGTGSVEGR